jgi:hypothetical protein
MSQSEDQKYQEFLKEVKSKLPAELQANLDAIAGTEAGKEIFRGGLREKDYYTRLNALAAEKETIKSTAAKQTEWYNEFQGAKGRLESRAQEAERLKAKLRAYEDKASEFGLDLEDVRDASDTRRSSAPAAVSDSSASEELKALREKVEFFDKALPKVLGDLVSIARESIRENFDVDPLQVVQFASENQVDPRTAFSELTKAEREKRASDSLKAQLEKAKEEGRQEALSKLQGPDRIRPSGPTIVDNLTDKAAAFGDHRSRVDEAVKDFLSGQV